MCNNASSQQHTLNTQYSRQLFTSSCVVTVRVVSVQEIFCVTFEMEAVGIGGTSIFWTATFNVVDLLCLLCLLCLRCGKHLAIGSAVWEGHNVFR